LNRSDSDYSVEVREYVKNDEQFVKTDLERFKKTNSDAHKAAEQQKETESITDKMTVIIKLQLKFSQYTIMTLRKLMKMRDVKTYKSDFESER